MLFPKVNLHTSQQCHTWSFKCLGTSLKRKHSTFLFRAQESNIMCHVIDGFLSGCDAMNGYGIPLAYLNVSFHLTIVFRDNGQQK